MERLPKNRKQTTFIRFIIQAIKIFAKQRNEILGFAIKFKGRVNRWRRTKSIFGQTGLILPNRFNFRIEYGTSKIITKKGTFQVSPSHALMSWVVKNTLRYNFK